VLVDLGAGCHFDDASMTSSQLGGGVFIALTFYSHSDHTTGASNLVPPELIERLATAPFCYRQSDMWALGLMALRLLLGREQGDALANAIVSRLSAVSRAVAATRSERDVTSALLESGAEDRPLSWQGVAAAALRRGASADTMAALQAMGEAVGAAARAVLVSGAHHGELAVQAATIVHGMLQFCPTCRMRQKKPSSLLTLCSGATSNVCCPFIFLTLRPCRDQQPVENPTAAAHRLVVLLERRPLSASDALWLDWLGERDTRVAGATASYVWSDGG
jgi:hypothetical protein